MGNCSCLAEKEKHDVTIETGNRASLKAAESDSNPIAKARVKDHVIDFDSEIDLKPIQDSLLGYKIRKEIKAKKSLSKPRPVKLEISIPVVSAPVASATVASPDDPVIEDFLQTNDPMQIEDSTVSYIGNPEDLLTPVVRKVLHDLPRFDYSKKVRNVTEQQAVRLNDGSVYVGEWFKSARFGKGKFYCVDGSFHEGYWKNGRLHYRGRVIYSTGDHYEGDFSLGIRQGKGKLVSLETKSSYDGDWMDDRQHGEGREAFSENNSTYIGHFEMGVKQGFGKFEWTDGSTYEGEFVNNMLEGEGSYVWADRRKYIGEWKENKMHGKGKFLWPDGRVYEGQYVMDKKEGYGVYQWENGKIYEGTWVDGKMHGQGYLTFPGKAKKKYSFISGKKGDPIEDND